MFPVYLKDALFEPPDDPIYYLVAANGVFLVKNHSLFQSSTPVKEISWLDHETPHFRYSGPLIEKSLLAKTLAFFVAVWNRYKAESIVVLYFQPAAGRHEIVVPNQTVGGIHVVYEESLPRDSDDLRLGTIHSHGHEDAFFSDRDNEDESFQDGVHLIFGNLDATPSLLCSAMMDGHRFPLEYREIIAGLPRREDLAPWTEWAEKQVEGFVRPLKKPIYFGT